MPTGEGRVEVEILPLIFQKDIAKVSIAMTNNRSSSELRLKYYLARSMRASSV